MVFFVLVVVGF